MANSRFFQFLFSKNPMLTFIEGNCVIDSGQPSGTRSLKGGGIKSISKIATGVYKVQLDASFNRYLTGSAGLTASVTGNTAIGSLTPGQIYVIRSLGSSTQANWETAGVPAGVPAAVGLAFVAAATSSGTGTCFSPADSGVIKVTIMGCPNLSVTNIADPHIIIATMGPTAADNTAMIPVAPVDESVLGLSLFLRNSSLKGKGE